MITILLAAISIGVCAWLIRQTLRGEFVEDGERRTEGRLWE